MPGPNGVECAVASGALGRAGPGSSSHPAAHSVLMCFPLPLVKISKRPQFGIMAVAVRRDIKKKVEEHLRAIASEAEVVYLLVQIRKMLDRKIAVARQKYAALRFYCDWALHIEMDRAGAGRILTMLNDALDAHATTGYTDANQHVFDSVYAALELKTFRKELRTFLRVHKLPTALTSDDDKWFQFIELYAGVIEDSPLAWSVKAQPKLKYIDAVMLKSTKLTPEMVEWIGRDIYPLSLRWVIIKNGRKQQVWFFEPAYGRRRGNEHHSVSPQG